MAEDRPHTITVPFFREVEYLRESIRLPLVRSTVRYRVAQQDRWTFCEEVLAGKLPHFDNHSLTVAALAVVPSPERFPTIDGKPVAFDRQLPAVHVDVTYTLPVRPDTPLEVGPRGEAVAAARAEEPRKQRPRAGEELTTP